MTSNYGSMSQRQQGQPYSSQQGPSIPSVQGPPIPPPPPVQGPPIPPPSPVQGPPIPPPPPQGPPKPLPPLLRLLLCLIKELFYFFCCITGQFHNHLASAMVGVLSVLSGVFCILLLLVNLGSLAFDIYVVAVCPYKDCSYFCSKYSSRDNSMFLLAINNGSTYINPEKYYNWYKILVSVATAAGFLSYYMMVFLVLIPLYSKCKCCITGLNKKCKGCLKIVCSKIQQAIDHESYLLPFDDSTESKQSTLLKPVQSLYFNIIYVLNLVLYFSSLGVFLTIIFNQVTTPDLKDKSIDITGLLFQFSSQFCVIQSSFIFSKVAYAVSNRCHDLMNKFIDTDVSGKRENVEEPQQHDNFCNSQYIQHLLEPQLIESLHMNDRTEYKEALKNARFEVLRKIDKTFINEMKATLGPYSHWFAVHWVLYIITTFMSIAFLAETYSQYVYSTHDISWVHDPRKRMSMIYIVLSTLEHAFLFAYPCFRAAQITSSRENLIKQFSNHPWKHIPLSIQSYFIEYLKTQNFGFKIVVLCLKITFGFNLAFVSIFVGGFGVILKLSS